MYHGIWWNAMALTQVDFNALSYCFLALTPLVIDTIVAPFRLIICLHIFLYYPHPTMQSSLLGLWIHYSHRHNIIFLLVFIIYSLTLHKIQVKNRNILPFSAAGNLLLNHSNKILYYYYLEMLMFPVLICTRKGWGAFDRLVPPGGLIGCHT